MTSQNNIPENHPNRLDPLHSFQTCKLLSYLKEGRVASNLTDNYNA